MNEKRKIITNIYKKKSSNLNSLSTLIIKSIKGKEIKEKKKENEKNKERKKSTKGKSVNFSLHSVTIFSTKYLFYLLCFVCL